MNIWDELEMEINICHKCPLEKVRSKQILGMGDKTSKVMFILGQISEQEDNRGLLLIDKKGEYFLKFLEFSKFNSDAVYMTNLFKCTAKGELVEKRIIKACEDYLMAQIALINPKIIVTVGELVTKQFIKSDFNDMRDIVGKEFDYTGGIKILPIYDLTYLFKATDKEKWQLVKTLEKLNMVLKEGE